jgi:hypothetical protein
MNKALVLIEALETIITKVNSQSSSYISTYEETLRDILTLAEDAINTVGGREEVEDMFEDLRIKTVDLDVANDYIRDYCELTAVADVKRLVEAIIPVLTAVDDLTDYGVSRA